MAYFVVSDFSSGLDVRKSPFTSVNGSLQTLDDGHITRGGEIEKRKALEIQGGNFADTFAMVAGKLGAGTTTQLVTFGDTASPPSGLPTGVQYQQLEHPDGGIELVGIADMTLFDGKIFVAADYADGSQWVFYDGALVNDWGGGTVRASMTTNDAIAEHMKRLIDASPNFSATRTGANIFITGNPGVDYKIATSTRNGGSTGNQGITVNEVTAPVAPVTGAQSQGEFAILAGSAGASNYIDQVRVDVGGVFTDLISSPVLYDTSAELTALNLVNAINAGTGSHKYSAVAKYGRVLLKAPLSAGAGANGRVIEVVAKGAIILYDGRFAVTGGTAGAGNEFVEVKVNGSAVTSAAVPWVTSDSVTAANVASNIRAFASSPKINAMSIGNTVYLSPEKIRSDDATGLSVSVTTGGTVTSGTGDAPPSTTYPDYGDPFPRPGDQEER